MAEAVRVRAPIEVLLALAAGAAACQGGGAVAGGGEPAANRYDQVMSGVSTTLTADSAHQMHVNADSAYVYQQAREIHFRRPGVTVFDRQDGLAALIQADRGIYKVGAGTFDLRGQVVLVTPRGDSLTTAHLVYDQRSMQLRGDTAFAFSTRAGVIRGSGFSTDLSMRGVSAGRRPDSPR